MAGKISKPIIFFIISNINFFYSIAHDPLLEIFLTLEDSVDGKGSPGVRKAKVILATSYLIGGGELYAKKIQEEFGDESHKVLWSLLQELTSLTNREFWEVTERGEKNLFGGNYYLLHFPAKTVFFNTY